MISVICIIYAPLIETVPGQNESEQIVNDQF